MKTNSIRIRSLITFMLFLSIACKAHSQTWPVPRVNYTSGGIFTSHGHTYKIEFIGTYIDVTGETGPNSARARATGSISVDSYGAGGFAGVNTEGVTVGSVVGIGGGLSPLSASVSIGLDDPANLPSTSTLDTADEAGLRRLVGIGGQVSGGDNGSGLIQADPFFTYKVTELDFPFVSNDFTISINWVTAGSCTAGAWWSLGDPLTYIAFAEANTSNGYDSASALADAGQSQDGGYSAGVLDWIDFHYQGEHFQVCRMLNGVGYFSINTALSFSVLTTGNGGFKTSGGGTEEDVDIKQVVGPGP